jgi:hypothetical protein
MISINQSVDRRKFLQSTALLTSGALGLTVLPAPVAAGAKTSAEDMSNIIGPIAGYAPQVGTLVSMMSWMRNVILFPVAGLTVEQLDYVHDAKANSIGAMLLHLAATERFYQLHTFENKKWGDWPEADVKRFSAASELGDAGRKNIKGNPLKYYLSTLEEVRSNTLSEFKKRDDAWLMSVDKDWPWGPTNNYCKWFHVCEHESNHNGQIKWLKSRLPGAKAGND